MLCDQHSLDKNAVLAGLEFRGVVFRCDGAVVNPRENEEHTNQLKATKAKNERLKSLLTSMTTARNKEKEAAAAEKGKLREQRDFCLDRSKAGETKVKRYLADKNDLEREIANLKENNERPYEERRQ